MIKNRIIKTLTLQLESVSPKECKINALILLLLINMPTYLVFYGCFKYGTSLSLYIIPFSFFLVSLGFCVPVAFYNELKERYDSKAKVKMEIPNPVYPLFLLFLVPGIALFISPIIWATFGFNNVLGLGMLLTFFIPLVLIFLRENVFYYDSALIINKETGEKDLSMGYNSFCYYAVSLIFGLYGYFYGFRVLSLNNNYFWSAVLWVFIVFLFQLIFVCPDNVNGFLPFELKRFDGFGKYLAIVVGLFCLFVMFCQNLMLGVGISITKYLTWPVILNAVIYLTFAIIVGKLYYNIFSKKNK